MRNQCRDKVHSHKRRTKPAGSSPVHSVLRKSLSRSSFPFLPDTYRVLVQVPKPYSSLVIAREQDVVPHVDTAYHSLCMHTTFRVKS